MIPTVDTSVIAFPRIEQRSKPPLYTTSEIERAVKLAAEDIRLNWLKSHATSSKVCARTRLLHAAAVADLSDNAFRVLFLQLSYTNGTVLRTDIDNETIATLARCNEKTVRRSNKELEAAGWVSTKKRRRDGAEKTMAIPKEILAQIGTEIMENLPLRLVVGGVDQDRTKMSTQEVLPVQNQTQDRTEMSTLNGYGKSKDRTKMSTQEVLPGYNSDLDWTEMSGLDVFGEIQDGTEMSTLGAESSILPGQNTSFAAEKSNSRLDKNVRLICKEKTTRKKNNKGAELDCIQSGREENCIQSESESPGEAQPPGVENFFGFEKTVKAASAIAVGLAAATVPVAAAPIEPAAIIQQAPQIPECWDNPRARQNAVLRPAEARAQREVVITADGCLEALGGFRGELGTKFPLVDLECGLLAAAPNVKPYMTAIETMGTIRRQFAYMQIDAKQKADRAEKISSAYADRSSNKTPERTPFGYDELGNPIYRGR
jgi:hypothetical protein